MAYVVVPKGVSKLASLSAQAVDAAHGVQANGGTIAGS